MHHRRSAYQTAVLSVLQRRSSSWQSPFTALVAIQESSSLRNLEGTCSVRSAHHTVVARLSMHHRRSAYQTAVLSVLQRRS
jgi:gamma-glutamyl-gamma-aminobutyrate hydrolase PuuD